MLAERVYQREAHTRLECTHALVGACRYDEPAPDAVAAVGACAAVRRVAAAAAAAAAIATAAAGERDADRADRASSALRSVRGHIVRAPRGARVPHAHMAVLRARDEDVGLRELLEMTERGDVPAVPLECAHAGRHRTARRGLSAAIRPRLRALGVRTHPVAARSRNRRSGRAGVAEVGRSTSCRHHKLQARDVYLAPRFSALGLGMGRAACAAPRPRARG